MVPTRTSFPRILQPFDWLYLSLACMRRRTAQCAIAVSRRCCIWRVAFV